MSTVTRDEFETVKELLVSAARYAESANRGIERLELAQQRTQLQIDQLAEAQKRTEQRFESFIFESQRQLTAHAESITRLEGISSRLEALMSYVIRKEGPGE